MNQYNENDYKNKCDSYKMRYIGNHKEKHKGTVVDFICPIHETKGVQSKDWSHFKSSKQPCSYCNGRKRSTEDAKKMIKNKNIVFVSEYKGAEKPVTCKCTKCGNVWISNRPMDLFRRENGCSKCSIETKRLKRIKPQEKYEEELKKINPNIKVVGKYNGTHRYIKCKCLVDGYEFESIACNLLNKSAGCPKCNMSVGENRIVDFMEKNSIRYTRQKTFDGCREKLPLKFDVFDEDHGIAIEFQGEQHYFPVDFETNSKEKAVLQFKELQKRDSIKKKYCNDNGIPLICIPYYERNNVENYLRDKIYNQLLA